MPKQHTSSLSLKSFPAKALTGLAILVLLGIQDCLLTQWNRSFCNAAGVAFTILPCILSAAAQAVQSDAPHHYLLLDCFLQILLTFLPQALAVAGAL